MMLAGHYNMQLKTPYLSIVFSKLVATLFCWPSFPAHVNEVFHPVTQLQAILPTLIQELLPSPGNLHDALFIKT